MSEWQPIETAPKDGSSFLAFVPIKNHRLMICRYNKHGFILDEAHQPAPWPVSHWMPLPKPPEETEK
jgi:Protein of unknown function (DUF551)